MHVNRQGVTKLNDVFSERQKVEILDVFNQYGELCYSQLVKKGKDLNKAFTNNPSTFGLIKDLIAVDLIVESKVAGCPFTGQNTQYWKTKEKSLEISEELKVSLQNVLDFMEAWDIYTLSRPEIVKALQDL